MADGNPLVAQAKQDGDGPGPLTAGNGDYGYATGIGIAESAMDAFNGIKDGDWISGGLGVLSLAGEVASAAIDPFGYLMSSVASFLMEHLQPLKDMLDSVAGKPPVIQSYADTWGNVAKALQERQKDYTNAVKTGTADWKGDAADAYRKGASECAEALGGAATVASAIGTVTMIMGQVVSFVRETVRQLIADLVGKLISWVMEEAFSLGFGTPVVVAQAVTAISKWGEKISGLLTKLCETMRKVSPLLGKLADVFTKIIKILGKLAGKVTGLDVISTKNIKAGGFVHHTGGGGSGAGGGHHSGSDDSGDSGGSDSGDSDSGDSDSGDSDSDGSDSGDSDSSGSDSGGSDSGSHDGDSTSSSPDNSSSTRDSSSGDGSRHSGDSSDGSPSGSGGPSGDGSGEGGSARNGSGGGESSHTNGSGDGGSADAGGSGSGSAHSSGGGGSAHASGSGGGTSHTGDSGGSGSGGGSAAHSGGGSGAGSSGTHSAHSGGGSSGSPSHTGDAPGSHAGSAPSTSSTPASHAGGSGGGATSHSGSGGGAPAHSGGSGGGAPAHSGGSGGGAAHSGGSGGGAPAHSPSDTSTSASGYAPPRADEPSAVTPPPRTGDGGSAPSGSPTSSNQPSPVGGGMPPGGGGTATPPGGGSPSTPSARPGSGSGWTGTPGSPGARTPDSPGPRAGGDRTSSTTTAGRSTPETSPHRPGDGPARSAEASSSRRPNESGGSSTGRPNDAGTREPRRPGESDVPGPRRPAETPQPVARGGQATATRPDSPHPTPEGGAPQHPESGNGAPHQDTAPGHHDGPSEHHDNGHRDNGHQGNGETNGHHNDSHHHDSDRDASHPDHHDGNQPHHDSHDAPDHDGTHHDTHTDTPDGTSHHHEGEPLTPDEVNQHHSESTPSGSSYHRGDPEMGDLPHRVQPDPDGRYTVDVHVTPDGHARIGDRHYTPEEFADVLRHNADYDGRPIRLIGCDAGSNDFANRLSHELDTPVLAPSKPAWSDAHGRVFSSDYEVGPDGRMHPRIPPDGEWSVHHPDGTSHPLGEDGFAPDGHHHEPDSVDVESSRHRGEEPPPDHDPDAEPYSEPDSEPQHHDQGRQQQEPPPAHDPDVPEDHNPASRQQEHDLLDPQHQADVRAHPQDLTDFSPTSHGDPIDVGGPNHHGDGPNPPSPDERWPGGQKLEPNREYRVHDSDGNPRGTYHTNEHGRVSHIEAEHPNQQPRVGGKPNPNYHPNPDVTHPHPNTTYRVGIDGHHQTFTTDADGLPHPAFEYHRPDFDGDPVHIGADDPHAPKGDKSFASGGPYEPHRQYDVTDANGVHRGTFYTDADGHVRWAEVDSGRVGRTNPDLPSPGNSHLPSDAKVTVHQKLDPDADAPHGVSDPDRFHGAQREDVKLSKDKPFLDSVPKHPEGHPHAGEPDLKPNHKYVVSSDFKDGSKTTTHPRTVVWTDEHGRVAAVETYRPHNPDLNNPGPNMAYNVDDGRFTYQTTGNPDGTADTSLNHSNDLQRADNTDLPRRDGAAQGQSNSQATVGQYDGGHIAGNQFKGPGELLNMLTQWRPQNQGWKGQAGTDMHWKAFETDLANHLKAGGKIDGIDVFALRGEGNRVPHTIQVRWVETDPAGNTSVHMRSFDNGPSGRA
ncbi:MAG TPA: hypothetical protein VG674_01950 [Amycolatopsis sp.]|nr:hypothetical protein [Amycolatopsis sp.]